jgi:hypothetical protein
MMRLEPIMANPTNNQTPSRAQDQSAEPRSFDPDTPPMSDDEIGTSTQGSGASAEDVDEESDPRQEALLDEGVEETFPASDPVSVKHIT